MLRALREQGVDVIFGYPGGAVLPIYDALYQQNSIRHILVRHEQAAVHAAEGYARSTGRVGVVLVTSGPGATNAVTGLVDALMDSIPVVCLTGQVPTHLIGNDAFQEADTTGITRPATKHNYLVKRERGPGSGGARGVLCGAEWAAGARCDRSAEGHSYRAGRLMRRRLTEPHRSYRPVTAPDPARMQARRWRLLRGAARPIVYSLAVGLSTPVPAASAALTEFVRVTGMPCTSTLMGLGAYPSQRSAVSGDAWGCTGPMRPIWPCMGAT